jgi:hypothetical protein
VQTTEFEESPVSTIVYPQWRCLTSLVFVRLLGDFVMLPPKLCEGAVADRGSYSSSPKSSRTKMIWESMELQSPLYYERSTIYMDGYVKTLAVFSAHRDSETISQACSWVPPLSRPALPPPPLDAIPSIQIIVIVAYSCESLLGFCSRSRRIVCVESVICPFNIILQTPTATQLADVNVRILR